jgi:hypothetical protein
MRQVRKFPDGFPITDDVVFIFSEMAANATLHSLSKGGIYTVRVKRYDTCVDLQVEDAEGEKCCRVRRVLDGNGAFWVADWSCGPDRQEPRSVRGRRLAGTMSC